MKKLSLLLAAACIAVVAQAQVVVGLQGGYFQQKSSNPAVFVTFADTQNQNRYNDTVSLSSTITQMLGGLQLGYQITPKLYAGIVAGYLTSSSDTLMSRDFLRIGANANSSHAGMWETVNEHRFQSKRSGWSIAPQVKYEFARYGNMHFQLMLQAEVRSLGYTTLTESYRKPFENNNELIEFDPYEDSISSFSWNVSLRPTLVYEFSQHLSAELSLDFLSIGYASETISQDGTIEILGDNGQTAENIILPHQRTTTTFYGGLNTLMQTLQWESPMLRLGFNWKF